MPDNISSVNAKRKERYTALITSTLEQCTSNSLKFSELRHLKKYVTSQTGIGRTTWGKNETYLRMLKDWMSKQPGAADFVKDNLDIHVVEGKLTIAESEIGNLRREVKRLKRYLARLQDKDVVREQGQSPVGAVSKSPVVESDGGWDVRVAFADTCALLALVLARAEVYAVDRDSRTIIDLTAAPGSPERVIAPAQRSAPFISWLELNHSLPYLSAVPTGQAKSS